MKTETLEIKEVVGFIVTSDEVEVVGEAKSLGVKSPLWKKI